MKKLEKVKEEGDVFYIKGETFFLFPEIPLKNQNS